MFHPGAITVCAGGEAAAVVVAGGGIPLLSTDNVTAPVPAGGGGGGGAPVPFWAIAMARNCLKLFSGVALMAKTMPLPQWGLGWRWRQYHPITISQALEKVGEGGDKQVASGVSTVISNVGALTVSFFAFGRNPES